VLAPGVLVVSEPWRAGLVAAEIVANRLRARARLRLLLPTGKTPRTMYAALREHARRGALPTGSAQVFQLDEYVGLGPADQRSFAATLDRELAGIAEGRREHLDGAAADPTAEARRYQRLLDEAPVDLAVLGIGRDGHLAFNEPGTSARSGVHRLALHRSTIDAAAADFGGSGAVPREALTVGLRTLRASREVVVLATGEAKADAVRAMLEGPPDPDAPGSLLRDHPALTVICDAAAARRLTPAAARTSDRVVVVLGHREPGEALEHRISAHSRARLFRAEEECLEGPVRVAILTGYAGAAGPSEAEQLAREWTVPDVPAVMEVAGRTTVENASRSLPIIVAMGGIRRVVVVTSLWHLRAPLCFSPYRSHGLRLDVLRSRPLRHWRHLLAAELRGLPRLPRQRSAAMAQVSILSREDVEGP
jgi:glucosamine-6-phosphate deaminase